MVMLIMVPCGGIVYCFLNPAFDIVEIISNNMLFLTIGAVIWLLLFKGANEWFLDSEYQKNMDAFCLITKSDFKKMSGKERKAYIAERKAEMNRILSATTINNATHPGSKNPDQDMEELIGMSGVKEKISTMVTRANYDKAHKNKTDGFASHYVFYGAPGTGKTTFARILTGFLFKNHIIQKNQCIEVNGKLLKASAPGEGGLKANILVKYALAGVLFIDEAYGMADEYGNETVVSLIKLMEDMRGQFVLILAGYTEPMSKLLSSNPGFRSHIDDYVKFPNHSVDEAESIFKLMAHKKGLAISKEGMDNFRSRYKLELQSSNFENARTVRLILNEAITKHAVRISKNKKANPSLLTSADININTQEYI